MKNPQITYSEFRELVYGWMKTNNELAHVLKLGTDGVPTTAVLLHRYFTFAGHVFAQICAEDRGGQA